jgi:hypothetical protein
MIQAGQAGADRRVVYECNFSVDSGISREFMQYLRGHMREVRGQHGERGGGRWERGCAQGGGAAGAAQTAPRAARAARGRGRRAAMSPRCPLSPRSLSTPRLISIIAPPQIVCLEEGALFDRATLCIAEAECGNDATKTLLVARYRALSRFHLQQYFDSEGARGGARVGAPAAGARRRARKRGSGALPGSAWRLAEPPGALQACHATTAQLHLTGGHAACSLCTRL